jgi:hypothetical protein
MWQPAVESAAVHTGAMHPVMPFRQLDGGGDGFADLDARTNIAAGYLSTIY